VRHGESASNRAQRWQGQGDSELSELGRTQAAALGDRIRGRHFDRVLASDLSRAVDTARATGFAFERDPSWREFDVGRWEGLTREEVEARYPEEIERLKNGEDIPLGGGESYAVFSARIDAALARLKAQLQPGEHALVVCHGGVIGTALAGLLGLRGTGRWPLSRATNTGISEVSLSDEGATLRVFNDARHIARVSPWPVLEAGASCIGLVSESAPHPAFGEFAAHYDVQQHAASLPVPEKHQSVVERFVSWVQHLGARHPERRVALSAPAALIHEGARGALLAGTRAKAELAPPAPGSVCHMGAVGGRLVLLDYGVSRD
jgi:probable phosphoglycerate mutase